MCKAPRFRKGKLFLTFFRCLFVCLCVRVRLCVRGGVRARALAGLSSFLSGESLGPLCV